MASWHCLPLRIKTLFGFIIAHSTDGRFVARNSYSKTLKGIPDEHTAREGLFDIIHKSKSHHQKRAYQCIKLLVALFSQCEAAKTLLDESEDIRVKWSWAVNWLNEELERGRGHYPGSGQFSYNNWSPPAQSNETANGYFLERSHSARLTLEKACELLPDEVIFYYLCIILFYFQFREDTVQNFQKRNYIFPFHLQKLVTYFGQISFF